MNLYFRLYHPEFLMAHQTCERLPTQTFRKELRKISQLENNPLYETWSQLQIPKNLNQVLEERMDFLSRYFFQLFQEYLLYKPLKSMEYHQELSMINARRWESQWDVKFNENLCQIIQHSFLGLAE
jgi:hypothetical protein